MQKVVLAAVLAVGAPAASARAAAVKTGLDVLSESGFALLQGKRVGLITNQTGRDAQGRSAVEILARAPGVALAALFSPEHGFAGAVEEGAVSSTTLRVDGRGIPVHSLYGGGIAGMRPKPEDLQDLDALVFDIQDIGARFYTYAATMGMALEEAKKAGLEFIVLDRPNPITGTILEGPILEDAQALRALTSTAYYPVPVRHGLTVGEIAAMHNAEIGHPRLTIVKMKGWSREMWYDQTGLPWTPPSPNMPDLDAAALYPGIGAFEAANVSVGRGTPVPFRWIGAPWMDAAAVVERARKARLKGVSFSVQGYAPTKSVFAGKSCRGVRMTITDRGALRPLRVFCVLHQALRALHPKEFVADREVTRRMVGTPRFLELAEKGASARALWALFQRGAKDFQRRRKPYLLY
ncbi:MAG: DUF1343 domain-containing protein [Elusimicrobia bacterium]|nr:DUF1343 domain-containing protein [Elusimicrobiota bacterium]